MDSNQNYDENTEKVVHMTRSKTKITKRTTVTTSSDGTTEYHSTSTTEVTTDDGADVNKGTMYMVFFLLTLDLIAFTIILPLLPRLLDYYAEQDEDPMYNAMQEYVSIVREFVGAPDTPKWNTVLFGGFIGSLFSLLQFVSSPILGALSDVYGRRPIMLLSMFGMILSYVVWCFSHTFTIFVLSRIIGGLSKGNVSLSIAIMADILPQEKRGRGMAMIGIAFSIGFVVGPIIGAIFAISLASDSDTFFTTPALLALLLSVVDFIIMYICLKETLPRRTKNKTSQSVLGSAMHLILPTSLFSFAAMKKTSQPDIHKLRSIGFVYFLYLFIFSGLEFTLTFLTHTKFEYTSIQQGKMFFFIGVIMIIVQGGFVRRVKPGHEQKTAVRGILFLMPSSVCIGLANSTLYLYSGLLLFSFSSAIVVPCLTTLISTLGTPEQRGTATGIFRSLGALARALGPIFTSFIYWSTGPAVCFTIGAVALVVPLMFLCKVRFNEQKAD